MYMIHADHLTGTNVVTDANGDVVEVADYYPYGTERISSGSFEEQRKFAGTEYDSGTGLNYMGARYYAGGKGRFLSEDPVFLSVGSSDLKQKTGLELQKYLENPQTHNSYSYAANNPMKYVDREGEWLDTVVDIFALAYSGYRLGHAVVNGGDVRGEAGNLALDVGGVFIPGVAGLGTWRRAANVAEGVKDGTRSIQAISKQYNWGNPKTLSDHFDRHGAAFGAKTPEEYARKANDFLGNATNKGFDSFVDQKGVTRIYDQKTNTFGSYNPDGTTKTFFKPDPAVHGYATNADYWKSLKSAIK